ncbi:MAG: MATE family efflux transporter [Myxococcales bacterium FL481]|nr:MAG: MATE family efflux transporter [Myxococcales bacterium FL481]
MVLEMGMESVFAVCDVFFVGRLGAAAVATVGLTESLMVLVYALAFGLAMSTTAVVARRYGEGNVRGAGRAGVQALLLGGGISLVVGIVGVGFAPQLLASMGAEPEVLETGGWYARVLLGTNLVVMLLFLGNAVFRGVGDAAGAMRALWLANGINLVLDPCLIFGLGPFPELGLTGAAIATSVGRGVGVLYQVARLVNGPRLKLRLADLRVDVAVMANIIRVSLGGVAQQLIAVASWVILVRIVAEFGSLAVASYTIAMRVLMFALLPSWGLANAAATLVGQSLGARDSDRAERAVWRTGLYNTLFLGSVSIVLIAIPRPIVAIFTDDVSVIEGAAIALRVVACGYVFYAWEMVMVQAFNGAGDTVTPTKINLFCFWGCQIGLAYWLAQPLQQGPLGVYVAVALSYSLAAVIAVWQFRRGRWKQVQV